ncbi:MAG TPA: hypothetical protein VMG13_22875 [Trebonia sp.]|nr:hypothetical protein [Trebonia sp.]
MRRHVLARGNAAAALAAAGVVLAVLSVAGCSGQTAISQASVESCVQFGTTAIRHQVTVTSLPPACRGLTAAQIDLAVGTALRSAGSGVHDKARRRTLIVKASHFLEHMFVAVPTQRSEPQVSAKPAGWISTATLGLTALCSLLITVALGVRMMARWILRRPARPAPAGRLRRPPALNFAHLGLASTSLLIWIAYLATGLTGLAWTATALLTLVMGLGMTLIFLPSASPADSSTAQALRAATVPDPGRDNSPHGRNPPVFTAGAHIIFAAATFLFAFLTAISIS